MHLQERNKAAWKPEALCAVSRIEGDTVDGFYLEKKQALDKQFGRLGLRVRTVVEEDFEGLDLFIKTYYYGYAHITPLMMHQIMMEGDSLLLVDKGGGIKGYILEISYLKNRVSHGVSMAIHPDLKGQSVGARLFMYSAITAMKCGAWLKKGMISPGNYPSIVNILNRCGAIATAYSENLKGLGPKLLFTLPLVPDVLGRNALDAEKIADLVHQGVLSEVPADDLEAIKTQFDNRRVVLGLYGQYMITYPAANLEPEFLC